MLTYWGGVTYSALRESHRGADPITSLGRPLQSEHAKHAKKAESRVKCLASDGAMLPAKRCAWTLHQTSNTTKERARVELSFALAPIFIPTEGPVSAVATLPAIIDE